VLELSVLSVPLTVNEIVATRRCIEALVKIASYQPRSVHFSIFLAFHVQLRNRSLRVRRPAGIESGTGKESVDLCGKIASAAHQCGVQGTGPVYA
jgi:hypothetical protein